MYKLTFTWRETDLYSALPAFANPFLSEGIIPGQHTYNRTRNIYDATLELLPGKLISPILQYTRNTYNGPGTTTYHLGGDEFLMNEQVNSTDELYRLGLGLNCGPVQAGFTQGWRYFRWKQVNTLVPGAGDGNVTNPVLGQDIHADAIASAEENKVNTPVTNAWVTGNLFGRLKLVGSYMKADGSTETSYVEADAGNFVGFEIARFFSGLGETVNSRARTDYWRGSARAELEIVPNVTLAGGWAENSRTLTGQALIASLYLNTVTYAGVPTGQILRQIDARTAVEQQNVVYDANVTARMLGPFAVNAGWSQTQQDVVATADAAEIVVPGGQDGSFERTVNTYGGGASFSMWGLTLTGDYRHDDANQPIFRTDYINRDRYKFRGVWNFKDVLKVGAVFSETDADDDIVEIGYKTKVREFVADVELTLLQNMLTLARIRRRVRGQPPDPHPGAAGLRDRPDRAGGVRPHLGGRPALPVGPVLARRRLPLDEQQRLHPLHLQPRPGAGGVLLHPQPRADPRVEPRQVRGARGVRPGRPARELRRQSLLRRTALAPLSARTP